MKQHARAYTVLLASLLCVSGSHTADMQVLHTTGQNVQPAFEGWERRPDGGFDMVFGYLNRNYVEEPEIPVSSLNALSPGPADRGQPTHFYPRRQSFVFRVTVPADWGEKKLIWTLTHNGRTATANGSLAPVWEMDAGVWKANRGGGTAGRTTKEVAPNQRPTVQVAGESKLTVSQSGAATLTVAVSDDGQPGPEPPRGRGPSRRQAQPMSSTGVPGTSPSASPSSQDLVKASAARETGLAVSWIHYRGAGVVTFEPRVIPINSEGKAMAGRASTTVRFSGPGTYVLRAFADDGIYTTPADFTVVVTGK